MMRYLLSMLLFFSFVLGGAQHINVGFTFQYLMLKQIQVHSNQIVANRSYSLYNVVDNRWRFFASGQSMVIGTIVQVDVKKFYFTAEPSFELNTYEYTLGYPTSPTTQEYITFHTLFFQAECPVYVGYMFKTSNLFRYSIYGGACPVLPYEMSASVRGGQIVSNHYDWQDMNNILYSSKPYLNTLAGFAIHYASLGRLDFRYVQRVGPPGSYPTTFNTVGFGLTFFLPLHLYKKKVYYEE